MTMILYGDQPYGNILCIRSLETGEYSGNELDPSKRLIGLFGGARILPVSGSSVAI
ncbi:hypothetical protein ES703_83226 [subsurface metagenome]